MRAPRHGPTVPRPRADSQGRSVCLAAPWQTRDLTSEPSAEGNTSKPTGVPRQPTHDLTPRCALCSLTRQKACSDSHARGNKQPQLCPRMPRASPGCQKRQGRLHGARQRGPAAPRSIPARGVAPGAEEEQSKSDARQRQSKAPAHRAEILPFSFFWPFEVFLICLFLFLTHLRAECDELLGWRGRVLRKSTGCYKAERLLEKQPLEQ